MVSVAANRMLGRIFGFLIAAGLVLQLLALDTAPAAAAVQPVDATVASNAAAGFGASDDSLSTSEPETDEPDEPGPPVVTAVIPDKAAAGSTVVIKGSGFDADPAGSTVTLNGIPVEVTEASATDLSVVVPAGATSADRQAIEAPRTRAAPPPGPSAHRVSPSATPPAASGARFAVAPDGQVTDLAAAEVPLMKAGSAGGKTAGKAFPRSVKDAALAENPSTCVYCRMETDAPQNDHVIPRARGGNATLDNAQTTCGWCNPSKGARAFPVNPPPGFEGAWPPEWWGLP